MNKIFIGNNGLSPFEGEQYPVDLDRSFGGYQEGDLICFCCPFFGIPLQLSIAIRSSGEIIFRRWSWGGNNNQYLHTDERRNVEPGSFEKPFIATEAQCDTVSGLFSGRIKFEGLKLAVGASVQEVCPIDLRREEQLTNRKIYLA